MKNATHTYTLVVNSPRDHEFIQEVLESYAVETSYIESGDKTNRGFFAVTRWAVEDIEEALAQRDIEPTVENINKVMAAERTIQDRLIETGWEVLDTIIADGHINWEE